MKSILVSLLFFFSVNAQNVWYVDRDATGANTGRSWADAWNTLDSSDWAEYSGVNWNIIGSGDTIYISGGTDSTAYTPIGVNNWYNGVRHVDGADLHFDEQVVITPAYHNNHNGGVYFKFRNDFTGTYLFSISNINNIKVRGINFIDNRSNAVLSAASLIAMVGDSLYLDSCYIFSRGLATGIGFDGWWSKMSNTYFEYEHNALARSVDILGASWGGGGLTFDRNIFIMRNGYERIEISPVGNVTVTDTSLTDDGIPSMITDYHIGSSIIAGGYVLAITGNSSNTFYGSAGWEFSIFLGAGFSDVTSTTLTWANNTAENIPVGAYVGCWAVIGSDSIQITSNEQYSLIGTGGWIPSTPANVSTAWEIHGGDIPVNGTTWQMGGFHKDFAQISGQGDTTAGSYTTTRISNNIFINQHPEGNEWNGFMYMIGQKNSRYLIYNNIFVHEKRSNIAMLWFHKFIYENTIQTALVFNNTIVMTGDGIGGGGFVTSGIDTVIAKNNLFLYDTVKTTYAVAQAGYKDFNYNHYAIFGGIPNPFAVGGPFQSWTEWIADGNDANSDTSDSRDVTFAEKWGIEAIDYYTETGRDVGLNLQNIYPDLIAEYPDMLTDILGNPRSGNWDIGALEFQGSPPLGNKNLMRGSDDKIWIDKSGKAMEGKR